ncbi:hypothetical protein LGT39_06385 [Demequina sp. TTPB684]|uniref:hypothetical protein n=1 Tax=unclassified Demequina TaxID=2620311 RepID=UPI001CF5BCFC|nr:MULTISPECIES: hypothetical protein [unclassified Demequina]MCB2412477.1 hypothetical protein [Demequina sp. TTPB684]UPU87690.1 hypothetical protein LGT36_010560 [Demequina sp. TMPB413]
MWLAQLAAPRNVRRFIGAGLFAVAGLALYIGFVTPLMAVLALIGVVTVAGSFFADTALAGHRRREAQAFAARHGWTYHTQLSGLLATLRTPPFNTSTSRYIHVIAGRFGGFECYDGIYEWHVRVHDSLTLTGRHRVSVVRLPDELPRLMLIPEGVTSALTKLLGGADRDFESASFNRNWRVVCSDARIAHDMLGPRVLHSLNALTPRAPMLFERGLAVRIDREGEGISSLASRLSGLIAIARYLPRHTVDDHGRLANSPGPLPSMSTPGALIGGYKPEIRDADEQHVLYAKRRKYDARFSQKDQSSTDDDGRLAPGPPAR